MFLGEVQNTIPLCVGRHPFNCQNQSAEQPATPVNPVAMLNQSNEWLKDPDTSLPVTRSNESNFVLPFALSYLNHISTVSTFEPMIRIGKLKSELDSIIGIPTFKRSDGKGEVSYFMEMLSSIVNEADIRKGLKNFRNIVLTKQILSRKAVPVR